MDIPGNVPQSHGTVGWDGHFTAFLDTYDNLVCNRLSFVLVDCGWRGWDREGEGGGRCGMTVLLPEQFVEC